MIDLYTRAVLERCDQLATYSEEPGRLTRRFATPAMRHANSSVATWMRQAGMEVRQDNLGNLRGRYAAARPQAPTLLLGSHLDSVPDAGKYDGPLGVLVALACVQRLADAGRRLPFAIELLAFADEEGVRYHTAYLGSSVLAGSLDPANLELRDADGIRMADAIRAFGGDPNAIAADRWAGGALLGYCEVHIEQGPVLEAENLPVGVVSGIQGQSRYAVRFSGVAGHAGTVPMALRYDALCAAAAFVLATEAAAGAAAGLVATIGQLTAQPGASNVIPGIVELSLDVRHQNDITREQACANLHAQAMAIAAGRGVICEWRLVQAQAAVDCAPDLVGLLGRAVAACGLPVRSLASGAGHDAAVLAALAPVAMLFVRCQGGISHNPAEAVASADVASAIAVMDRFLALLAEQEVAP